MQFESQWPGDAIAAPFCPVDDREDGFFEGRGDKSWNRVDSRVDADPTAAVQRSIRHTEPVRSSSKPNRPGRWVTVAMSLVIDHVIEGFALSATTLHPEFSPLASEQARREHETGTRACGPLACLETARGDVAGRRKWIFSITSFFAEIWSKMLREREIRHIRAAWEMIDDRTLRDIGISRYEIEYAKDPRN
jgi:uncharacterized protein YjiS (DUF1127 family)